MASRAAVVEILVPYAGGNAERRHLEEWINRPGLRVTAVIDASPAQSEVNQSLGGREQTLLVELPSMRVLWRQSFGGAADIRAAIDELERRAR